jgi:hypothetical protein
MEIINSKQGVRYMPKIRGLDQISRKWGEVTPARATEYVQGVQSPKEDWKSATLAGAKNYELGIQTAIANKQFDKGVSKSSTEDWQRKAVEKGGARFGPGVTAGVSDYNSGFAPYRDVIANTSLPARYPKGDPRNIERVRVMAKALRDKKVSGG